MHIESLVRANHSPPKNCHYFCKAKCQDLWLNIIEFKVKVQHSMWSKQKIWSNDKFFSLCTMYKNLSKQSIYGEKLFKFSIIGHMFLTQFSEPMIWVQGGIYINKEDKI